MAVHVSVHFVFRYIENLTKWYRYYVKVLGTHAVHVHEPLKG